MIVLSLLYLYLIALALSTKTFSVTSYNRAIGPVGFKPILKISIFFAVIQAAMIAVGWFTGLLLSLWVEQYKIGLAYSVIAIVGIKIIFGTFKINARLKIVDPSKNSEIFILALATAIDVFIAGLALGLFDVEIIKTISLLGLIVLLMGLAGSAFGTRFKMKYTNLVEFAGGLILVFVGVRGLVIMIL